MLVTFEKCGIYIYNILMVQVLGLKTMDHIFFRYLMFHIFLKLAVLVISGFCCNNVFYLLVALNGHCVR